MDTKQIRKNMNAKFDGNDIELVVMETLCMEVDTLRNENDAQSKEIERLKSSRAWVRQESAERITEIVDLREVLELLAIKARTAREQFIARRTAYGEGYSEACDEIEVLFEEAALQTEERNET